MGNEIATIAPGKSFSLVPSNLSEAMEFAKLIANSDLVPTDFRNKPGNVLVAVQMGGEVGLPPLQAVQNIAVINGRPTIWGDALVALVRGSGHCEYITDSFDEKTLTATCKTKRKGEPTESVRTFSKADADTAKLWGKQGPWSQYPKRMLQQRARAFLLRDVYADVLKGLAMREEVEDYQPIGKSADGKTEIQAPKRKSEAAPAPETPVVDATPASPEPAPATPTEPPKWTQAHGALWNSIVDLVGSSNGAATDKLFELTGKRDIKALTMAEVLEAAGKISPAKVA